MLTQNMEDHSSGLRDSIRMDLQFFHLAVTRVDGAQQPSTSSDQETRLLALSGRTGGGSY